MEVGLIPFRSPLLRESLLISFPLLLRCFSSQSNLPAYAGSSPITETEFPHSEIPGYSACLAAYRGLSQLATSFIGVQSRGIHVMRMSNVFSSFTTANKSGVNTVHVSPSEQDVLTQ